MSDMRMRAVDGGAVQCKENNAKLHLVTVSSNCLLFDYLIGQQHMNMMKVPKANAL